MTKIILPGKVAKAMDVVWNLRGNSNVVVKHLYMTNWNQIYMDLSDNRLDRVYGTTLESYAKEHPIEYMTALVRGYEVEKTPEEQIKMLFDGHKEHGNQIHDYLHDYTGSRYDEGICYGIFCTLNILNIKIPGINAPDATTED